MARIKHIYVHTIEKLTIICEWQKKMKQNNFWTVRLLRLWTLEINVFIFSEFVFKLNGQNQLYYDHPGPIFRKCHVKMGRFDKKKSNSFLTKLFFQKSKL